MKIRRVRDSGSANPRVMEGAAEGKKEGRKEGGRGGGLEGKGLSVLRNLRERLTPVTRRRKQRRRTDTRCLQLGVFEMYGSPAATPPAGTEGGRDALLAHEQCAFLVHIGCRSVHRLVQGQGPST